MDLSLADPCRCVYGVRCSESPVKERDSYRDLSRYNAVPLVGLLARERWQTFEISWGKTQYLMKTLKHLLPENVYAQKNVHSRKFCEHYDSTKNGYGRCLDRTRNIFTRSLASHSNIFSSCHHRPFMICFFV